MPPVDGWLDLWNKRSGATLRQLQKQPSSPLTDMATVLPWPTDNSTHKTPRDHIKALGINPHRVAPLKSTRAFNFETRTWKEGSTAEVDT